MVRLSISSREPKPPENQSESRRRGRISTAVAIGAISFVGGPMATQVPELHAASPIKQSDQNGQLESFGALEGRLTPARPLGSLMVAGNVRVMSHAQEAAQKSETSTASAEYIRKVTKRCRVTPKPGLRFCPEKRGPDYVPKGGWKVFLKPGFNDWADKNSMIWNEDLRTPLISRTVPFSNLPIALRPRIPRHPDLGFAPSREYLFERLGEDRANLLLRLAKCESGDRLRAVSPGGKYVGPYQVDSARGYINRNAPDLVQLYRYRGIELKANQLTQGEYDLVVARGLFFSKQSWGAFPTCRAGLG